MDEDVNDEASCTVGLDALGLQMSILSALGCHAPLPVHSSSSPVLCAGNPDGLKLDVSGNVFATGPGGVLVWSPDGAHLGTLLTGKKTANVAFGKDGYLYICANDLLGRIQVSCKGAGVA